MKSILIKLVFLLSLWLPGVVMAHHGTAAQAYLEDTTGQLDLKDVQQSKDWQAFDQVLMLGYKDNVVWLKVYPDERMTAKDLLVRVRPSYLDDVRVFLPKADGYVMQQGGDLLAKDQMEIYDTAISFAWRDRDISLNHPLYVRIKTTSTLAAHVQILPLIGMDRYLDSEKLLMGIYFGVTLLVLIWSFFHGVWKRDLTFLSFSIYLVFSCIMSAAIMGYWGRFVVPFKSTNIMTSCVVMINSATGLFFQRVFLSNFGLGRGLRILFEVMVAVAVVAVAIVCVQNGGGYTQYLLKLNALAMFVICFVQLIAASQLQMKSARFKQILLAVYLLFVVLVIATILPLLGLIQASLWLLHSSIMHGLMAAVMLGGILLYRKQLEEEAVREAEASLLRVKAEADATRALSEERENFLVMLAHEMRTPLSVIKMSVSGQSAQTPELQKESLTDVQKAIQDMTSILDLSVQVDKLDRGEFPLQLQTCDLPELINEVAMNHPGRERFQFSVDNRLPEIKVDPVILRTILTNLLENALKYSLPKSIVSVNVSLLQTSLFISVTNDVGEAGKPDPQKVFSKYYRAPGAYHSTGSGLGLYLVAGLVKMIGGEIRMLSTGADVVCFEVALKLDPHASA